MKCNTIKNNNIANKYKRRKEEGEMPVIFLIFARREAIHSVWG